MATKRNQVSDLKEKKERRKKERPKAEEKKRRKERPKVKEKKKKEKAEGSSREESNPEAIQRPCVLTEPQGGMTDRRVSGRGRFPLERSSYKSNPEAVQRPCVLSVPQRGMTDPRARGRGRYKGERPIYDLTNDLTPVIHIGLESSSEDEQCVRMIQNEKEKKRESQKNLIFDIPLESSSHTDTPKVECGVQEVKDASELVMFDRLNSYVKALTLAPLSTDGISEF